MADRIVQLEDNEGNKVYPISAFDESAVLIDTTSPESTPFDISTMGSYSLEEVETPFTWVDGKKIYKKTFRVTSGFSASMTISTGINIDTVISLDWMGKRTPSSGNVDYFHNFYRSNDDCAYTFVRNNDIHCNTSWPNSLVWLIFTLYYTKL